MITMTLVSENKLLLCELDLEFNLFMFQALIHSTKHKRGWRIFLRVKQRPRHNNRRR